MSFQVRHRWLISKLKWCFGFDDEAVIEDAIRKEENYTAITALFSAKGPRKLFFFLQPRDVRNEIGEWVAGQGEPELFATDGVTDALRGRCVWFLRKEGVEKNLDLSKGGDGLITYGVVGDGALDSVESVMFKCYQPLMDKRADYGAMNPDDVKAFTLMMGRFVGGLQASLKSMTAGLELSKPSDAYDLDGRGSMPSTDDWDMVGHFVDLLAQWCVQVENYLDDGGQRQWEGPDAGPDTELEYWRRRMQRLTSITEQLKTKECKTVIAVLSAVTKSNPADMRVDRQRLFALLRRWRQIDINITEAANEAKDNVKYLQTLEKFIDPLYNGTPQNVIDALPALLNSIKMIHTIARYYNTTERMTGLFMKITNQMITNCTAHVNGSAPSEKLWERDPDELLSTLEDCLRLNEAYQEQYRLTKDKLLTMPKGRQFDFSETQIFSKFDLFCRRVIKLIDMFSTIHQFQSLAQHHLEGMEALIATFFRIVADFKKRRHNLLDYHSNKFDRDYVEFNVSISDLEGSLQTFINQSFENITSIEQSLALLKKFQTILQRESLKNDLDSKFTVIFHNYGLDLTTVQEIYEKYKHNPPIARNMPPVAGNIIWSRHLLHRIEEPMRRFESNPTVLATKDSRKIIKTYNKVARTLVAFEYLWYEAWCRSIETSKAGLQATLIIRHPKTKKLYVNFDPEILQLIRESKCLSRIGIEVPPSARIVLLQEEKFKMYFNELNYMLQEYERVMMRRLPVVMDLIRPHVADLDLKLRPGTVTLTWTSMNIDAYKHHVHAGMLRLDQLLSNVNDIVENRIEKNLKTVTRTLLVDLPKDESLALDEFVVKQERHVKQQTVALQAKNIEVESAVQNIIDLVRAYQIDPLLSGVQDSETDAVTEHYSKMMYTALRNCTTTSLNALKKRVCSRAGSGFLFVERPFFEVDVQLAVPSVRLSPSLDDIQRAVNKAALAVLRVSKNIWSWGQGVGTDVDEVPEEERMSFFSKLGEDVNIVKVVLLLTGALHGTRNQVHDYLQRFHPYDWLWKDDKEMQYKKFMMRRPEIEDFETELKRFLDVEKEIEGVAPIHVIGALSLNTKNIKLQLRNESRQWKVQYSDKVHHQARDALYSLMEYIRKTTNALTAEVNDLRGLRKVMEILKEVRERESAIEMEINPITDMYNLLDHYIAGGVVGKEEMDKKTIMRSSWRKLSDLAEEVSDNLSAIQGKFKRQLLQDLKNFGDDVATFRSRYVQTGPAVQGIDPSEAVVRLKRFQDEYMLLARKEEQYGAGEELFAMKRTSYPSLEKTKKELKLLNMLYELYIEVNTTMEEYHSAPWARVVERIEIMDETVAGFDNRCKRLPKSLRDWDAYVDLSTRIADFLQLLPLLQELSKESVQNRHWLEVMRVTKTNFVVDANELKLQTLVDANLIRVKEDIEEICDSADKQMQIDHKMSDVRGKWSSEALTFEEWKTKKVPVLKGYNLVIEDLEESQLALQTMLSMRHVGPFKEQVAALLTQLSDTADTLELWLKVQLLWQSLESVFTGGDIMKQMPLEAKKFSKIDKDWAKLMYKAQETAGVVTCCSNELLRNSLPVMYAELEKCQKSLEGYLEQKRSSFPRFYFVSNSVLLQILSRGSDPFAVQIYYEKLFDSVSRAVHDPKDKSKIIEVKSISGADEERIQLLKPSPTNGSIEDWLGKLLRNIQATMKDICERASDDCLDLELREFVDRYPGQFALFGLQLKWTMECTDALERCKASKSAMQENNKLQLRVLDELSQWTLDDLGSKMNRKKIETLITIQVHQRDVFAELTKLYKERKISGPSDFEWLKQARFYWNPEVNDFVPDTEGAAVISVCDVDFHYSHEYLGCKERLVITPLTDRAYITLTQALGMSLGGAPAGPAGTGKTETVKDLGRTLGLYVVVTNCTDNHSYKDMAKIFKGLCQAGLWGCFDEFNRIRLPVLSVVAQQVLSITNAKRSKQNKFQFPGDPEAKTVLNSSVGYFITMNPGYQGRQELPENLKVLFRSVAMMVPDREMIIRVKLCAVGFKRFSELAKKFRVLYRLCEEQLSDQRHYDFGLRNILSVLRTAGKVKRDNIDSDEGGLLMRTLRDMNLSKLVAQDTPLFISLLADLFPGLDAPKSGGGREDLNRAIDEYLVGAGLLQHPSWMQKVQQLYDTYLVRHGIMLVGPAGGGKSQIVKTLASGIQSWSGVAHKCIRMNPKAIGADEMFGETDFLSGEWMDGVFASMWSRANKRTNKWDSWLICDGPVDAIWIENLNTVLDDNKILTLANGDRIPMTDNVKLMFEVENLNNASPATVSRAGIVYVSDTDLDWWPPARAWIKTRPEPEQAFLEQFFVSLVGDNVNRNEGAAFTFIRSQCHEVVRVSRVGAVAGLCALLGGLLDNAALSMAPSDMEPEVERLFLYSMAWAIGGRLDAEDRIKFDQWMRQRSSEMPKASSSGKDKGSGTTIFDFYIDSSSITWQRWTAPEWQYPHALDSAAGPGIDFSSLLIPTEDSVRSIHIMKHLHAQGYPTMMIGGTGTAKSATAQMFCDGLNTATDMLKKVGFSFATTAGMFQGAVENEMDKRGGKTFGPPGSKQMVLFLDDISMPAVNEWGDQPTLECVRQLVADSNFCFLDKDRRGDLKTIEDIRFLAAGNTPAGGRNDIPQRLKRLFFIFNMVPPSTSSIDDIYGKMLKGRYDTGKKNAKAVAIMNTARKLTNATLKIWVWVKKYFLPTPAKFHYIFNMRDISRVFQGVLRPPKDVIKNDKLLIQLWRHETKRVFCDKLADNTDKKRFLKQLDDCTESAFGKGTVASAGDPLFIDYMRGDEYDEDGVLTAQAPRVYERGGKLDAVRTITQTFLDLHNAERPRFRMDLVLFDDALEHLVRVSRIIGMARGNALLVGVGGSGKRSMTRLAAFIARQEIFSITISKSYSSASLLEDIAELYRLTGQQGKGVTWIFTDSDIKEEIFLEQINSILMSGEVSNLFPKDELNLMVGDLRTDFAKERPDSEDSIANLVRYFIDRVRKNLHLVLCMSPMNPKFAERARRFPGIINGTMIDYFLPWPKEALVGVAQGKFAGGSAAASTGSSAEETLESISDLDDKRKMALSEHMGHTHATVVRLCGLYFEKMRRHAHQTPKTYLSYLELYKSMYEVKLAEIKDKEVRIGRGLEKLKQGAKDVEKMKIELAKQEETLLVANKDCSVMLSSLQVSSLEAKKESDAVGVIRDSCMAEAKLIGTERQACEEDLAKAQPYLDEAERAVNSIKPNDLNELKKLPKPSDIIKLVFDCVSLLRQQPMTKVEKAPVTLGIGKDKKTFMFIQNSYPIIKAGMLSDAHFLKSLFYFSQHEKDNMNDETLELMAPYLELEAFVPSVARNASKAAEGLCAWVRAMAMYHHASKVVKPKLEKLALATAKLEEANKQLAVAEESLGVCKAKLDGLQAQFEEKMAEKTAIEDSANATRKKMQMAQQLIDGLSGERQRWGEDAKKFQDEKERLLGDCAMASAFLSYCGVFDQSFRENLLRGEISGDLVGRKIPLTKGLDLKAFLIDQGTVGEWAMQGLPTDSLSVDNGILVTSASRFPLLIDPQGQGLNWISRKEAGRLPAFGTITLANNRLRDHVEYTMGEGMALIIAGIEEEIDPMLNPLLEKTVLKKGRSEYINIGDKLCEFNRDFMLYLTTRLPNPHFSPELQARTMVVNFTVTRLGLEEQLLGRVIQREQSSLEEQLNEVLTSVAANTKALLELDKLLLKRLTDNEGNLLDDVELISVLAETKAKATEVNVKLVAAQDTRQQINEKREQYRPVATRGSVLYFCVVDMSAVSNMYQTSLTQFLSLFNASMEKSEKANLPSVRVTKIVEAMTYIVYRYMNRALYGSHRLVYVLLVACKILTTAAVVNPLEVTLLLKGGASLDAATVRENPFSWLDLPAWLNVMQLSKSCAFFAHLPEELARSEAIWKRWYEENEPEKLIVPDYDSRLTSGDAARGSFLKLLLVRSLRPDRTILASLDFVKAFTVVEPKQQSREAGDGMADRGSSMPALGPKYVDPITDTIEEVYNESTSSSPVVYLLSAGSDPTDEIGLMARRKKTQLATVSLGEGQEPYAIKAITNAVNVGTWVLLQNCHLGLDFVMTLEQLLDKSTSQATADPAAMENFRLWLTTEPHSDFPIGLLQRSMKVTNEPPAGLRAGLLHSYTAFVDQDKLERVDSSQWRTLLFGLCFLHSCIMERRKFGALGWCIPYEFNVSDLQACAQFLERHLYAQAVSWPTLQYIVSEVQYGGKITDDLDSRLFKTYASMWLTPSTLAPNFTFNPSHTVQRMPKDFIYSIPDGSEIDMYRSYISTFPEIDSPEIFGLHPNADMTYRMKEVTELLDTVMDTQPKESSGDGTGKTREDTVLEKAQELLDKLPTDYVEDTYVEQIGKLGGMSIPLNIFLYQEIQRLQAVIASVRNTLSVMMQAIRGEVVLTAALVDAINSIFDARVPKTWVSSASGAELSWLSPTLGLWFTGLLSRQEQLSGWVAQSRPPTFWLTGFFNPQGFLTAMRQEVTRAHAMDKWSLDDVVFHTEVTEYVSHETVKKPPAEGVYIHGLFLDGCAWSKSENTLIESEPKKLFSALPVLFVTAVTSAQLKGKSAEYGPYGAYSCPCYRYRLRGDRFKVFDVQMASREHRPQHWIVRGVALLCSTE
eukprot:g2825.t1